MDSLNAGKIRKKAANATVKSNDRSARCVGCDYCVAYVACFGWKPHVCNYAHEVVSRATKSSTTTAASVATATATFYTFQSTVKSKFSSFHF